MDRDDLKGVVIRAIASVKDLPEHDVTVDSRFEDLDVDSFDAIEVIFELEEAFDIDIPDEVARGVESVGDVVERLAEALSAGEASEAGA